MEDIKIEESLDQLFQRLSSGSLEKAAANNLYGINYRQSGNFAPMNKDVYGFTFFTRPQLCLNKYNIGNYRPFYPMLTDNPNTLQAFIRNTLDPRTSLIVNTDTALEIDDKIQCPFVDPRQAFIPVLTNNIKSISGWPDFVAPEYTSKNGVYMEQHSMVDGTINKFESYDVTASFKNTKGDPISYLIYTWMRYQTLVFEGVLSPYIDYLKENMLDYNTRIYRIILDENKRYVKKISCSGASFPLNVPTSTFFDFNDDEPYNQGNKEISIRFKCNGFIAFEDIVKFWFNRAVTIFNPDMNALHNRDSSADKPDDIISIGSMVKIPYTLTDQFTGDAGVFSFNHRVYPWIDLHTSELQWWVSADLFDPDGVFFEGI